MRTVTRPHLLQVTLSDRERALLIAVAQREQKTMSELAREALRAQLQRRDGGTEVRP
jgi:predicted transcriptional regulator